MTNKSNINITKSSASGGDSISVEQDIFDTRIINVIEKESLGFTDKKGNKTMSIWYNAVTNFATPPTSVRKLELEANETKTFYSSIENFKSKVKKILAVTGSRTWIAFSELSFLSSLTGTFLTNLQPQTRKGFIVNVDTDRFLRINSNVGTKWRIELVQKLANGVETVLSYTGSTKARYLNYATLEKVSDNKYIFAGTYNNNYTEMFLFELSGNSIVKGAYKKVYNKGYYIQHPIALTENVIATNYQNGFINRHTISGLTLTNKSYDSSTPHYKFMSGRFQSAGATKYVNFYSNQITVNSVNASTGVITQGTHIPLTTITDIPNANWDTTYSNFKDLGNSKGLIIVANSSTKEKFAVIIEWDGTAWTQIDKLRLGIATAYGSGGFISEIGTRKFFTAYGIATDTVETVHFEINAGLTTITEFGKRQLFSQASEDSLTRVDIKTHDFISFTHHNEQDQNQVINAEGWVDLPLVGVESKTINGEAFSDISELKDMDIEASDIYFEIVLKNEKATPVSMDFSTNLNLQLLIE